jgi:hypothetical protein
MLAAPPSVALRLPSSEVQAVRSAVNQREGSGRRQAAGVKQHDETVGARGWILAVGNARASEAGERCMCFADKNCRNARR